MRTWGYGMISEADILEWDNSPLGYTRPGSKFLPRPFTLSQLFLLIDYIGMLLNGYLKIFLMDFSSLTKFR